ncbi:MAG: hypothetical protein JO017_03365, partial [Actinobacteria bacterium]|nr:hypothetical protein [Actinomycetota bacterium]
MLRKLVIVVLAAGALAVPAGAQPTAPMTLMPGVTYTRQVEFTPRGPVVLDVVTAPRPDGSLYTLAPAVAHNALSSAEPLTGIEKDLSGTETSVGVNGDFFASTHGPPTGI